MNAFPHAQAGPVRQQGRGVDLAGGLGRLHAEQQLEVLAQVRELGAQRFRVLCGPREDEAALEDSEDPVGERRQVHLGRRRVRSRGVCVALAALFQARQVRRRGSSCDVSARFFAMYAGGYAIWLMYGVSIGSVPLILVDAAGLICGGITLAVTLSMRGSLARPRSWGQCA